MSNTAHKWVSLVVLGILAGCGDTSETAATDANAMRLLAEAREQNYTQNEQMWVRAPYFDSRRGSMSPHGSTVEIWVKLNTLAAFEANPEAPDWPVGTTAIKHGYDENENMTGRFLITRMETGWFFAAMTPDDRIMDSGQPDLCLTCHGGKYSWFRFVDFP